MVSAAANINAALELALAGDYSHAITYFDAALSQLQK